jgi:hypothetical protein
MSSDSLCMQTLDDRALMTDEMGLLTVLQWFDRRNLCQEGLSVFLYAWSFPGLLFMEEDDVQPPSRQ